MEIRSVRRCYGSVCHFKKGGDCPTLSRWRYRLNYDYWNNASWWSRILRAIFFNSYNQRKKDSGLLLRSWTTRNRRWCTSVWTPAKRKGKIETINSVQINLNNLVRDRKGTWKTINLKETSSNANHMQGERCRDFVDFRLHDCKHILIIWGVQQASNLVISIDQVQRRKNKRPITLRKLYHY